MRRTLARRTAALTTTVLGLMLLAPSPFAQDGTIDTGEGEAVYTAQCAACHQPTGEGLPGVFPPLAGHIPDLVNAEDGRTYPILVVLHGLAGPITVEGATYDSLMPPLGGVLSDEQIADVLNYVATAWGNAEELDDDFEAFTPDEVAQERDRDLQPNDVHALRPELEAE